MNNELQIFNYATQEVRTIFINNEMWFIAKDVCDILDIANPTVAMQRLDEDERSKFNLGRQGETNIVNEYGLYSLIFASRKPEAKEFKRWIAHEVLPSIRKNGMYATDELLDNPDLLIQVATRLKIEKELRIKAELENSIKQQVIEQKEEQIITMQPKVDFADTLLESKDTLLIREYAKVLQKDGFTLGEGKLFKWLKAKEYLMNDNYPYQRYMKYFIVKECTFQTKYGTKITHTPKINSKGQYYFYNKLKEEGYFKESANNN